MVFYRKYRPQTISELDLTSVREKLSSILKSRNIPHAFLFTGPKGLGKTSAARIVAKAINCERRNKESGIKNHGEKKAKGKKAVASPDSSFIIHDSRDIEPCNQCSACVSITNGSNIDVLEIDAASNRGIDEIRELRERVKFAPATLPRKVYIIDEVHMLTPEAFNALLKTLEEPPQHVLFVLATTEPWKLPPTIVSRAFHIQFEKPTDEQIKRSLSRIVKGENLDVNKDVLEKIAQLSDGAFRDAAKILEELALSTQGRKITLDVLEKTYRTESIDAQVLTILQSIAKKNVKDALVVIDSLAKKGSDFKLVTERIVDALRLMLFENSGIYSAGVIEKHPKGVSVDLDIYSIELLLEYFNEAYKNIRFSVLPQLPLELAVVRYCVIDQEETSNGSDPHGPHEKKYPMRGSDPTTDPATVGGDNFLKALIEKVKGENHSIAGVLRSCRLVRVEEGEVEFLTPYKFHSERLHDGKVKKIVEQAAAEILGKNVKIIVTIKEKN